MRTSIATLAVAALITILVVPAALATPTQVNVRIEGKSETLFEGPITTEGHDIEASSDTQKRPCDGTNNEAHTTPGPTPTTASVDAMSTLGETFDGQWYPGYDDYFITRWGPDEQDIAEGAYWGVLVNNVFTPVGGCQYELGAGNEVLWVYDAFQTEPFLALLPVQDDYTSGVRPLTATARLGEPFEVEVLDYADDQEDNPPSSPERNGAAPFEGADVAPVTTSAKGFEKVETSSPQTVTTDAQGKASITFDEPGWHRIMATVITEGKEDTARSNRLDVCVPAPHEPGCGEPPAEDQLRTPPPTEEGIKEAEAKRHEQEAKRQQEANKQHEEEIKRSLPVAPITLTPTGSPPAPTSPTSPVSVQTPVLDQQGAARGLTGVSWQILNAGVGLRSWTIASKTLGQRGAGYVTRATGTSATSTLLALPAGADYELQITITDLLGRSSTTTIGTALIPEDDRWSGLRYGGRWRRMRQPGAWFGTISRGEAGTKVSMRLGAGRPVFQLRGTSSAAEVEVLTGSRREVFTVARGSSSALRQLVVADRSHAGAVTLLVLKGTVDLDGVALEP